MSKFAKILVCIIVVMSIINISISHSRAATNASISLVGVSNSDGVCSHGNIDVSYTFTPTTDNGLNVDTVGIVFTDGYGTLLAALYTGAEIGTGPQTQESVIRLGISPDIGTVNDIQARPVIVTLYDTNIEFLGPEFTDTTQQQIQNELTANGTVLATARFDPAQIEGF
jgi:hypothetical protein